MSVFGSDPQSGSQIECIFVGHDLCVVPKTRTGWNKEDFRAAEILVLPSHQSRKGLARVASSPTDGENTGSYNPSGASASSLYTREP